jgi:hypothetical protein
LAKAADKPATWNDGITPCVNGMLAIPARPYLSLRRMNITIWLLVCLLSAMTSPGYHFLLEHYQKNLARFVSLWFCISLVACTTAVYPPPTAPWEFAQLRALDPSDMQLPGHDLIALYTRRTTHNLEIRLDVLELQLTEQGDIYLALDWLPGGSQISTLDDQTRAWDLSIVIPAGELASARVLNPYLNADQLPTPLVVRDPKLDTITVRLNIHKLPQFNGHFYAAAYSAHPGTETKIDEIGPVSSEAHVSGRAPLLLAFWNTMPAQTPAQALRRWDGAHTGPLGQRHGLSHLLDAAEYWRTPVVLLDAAAPLSLAALDMMGQIPQLTNLQSQGLLNLTETLPAAYFGYLPDWAINPIRQHNRAATTAFGVRDSQWVYAPTLTTASTDRLIITPDAAIETNQTHIYQLGAQLYLPLPMPANTPQQIDYSGLNRAIRQALIQAALTPEESRPLTVLGGDLPHSNWGDAHLVGPAMAYIAAHPWMQVLNERDLLTQPRLNTRISITSENSNEENYSAVYTALRATPDSTSADLAYAALLTLLAPADPLHPNLAALRANYLGEIGTWLAAAKWELAATPLQNGEIFTDCTIDPDFDGEAECLLASTDYFAIIDPQGGRLSLLLARQKNGSITQLVAPSSQFAVGLSDPLGWDLAAGVQADPGVIPGGFAGPWDEYRVEHIANGVRLKSTSVSKTFTLANEGLHIEYVSETPIEAQIPLGIMTENYLSSGWAGRFEGEELPQGWAWGIKDNAQALIQTSGRLTHQTFRDDIPALSLPENPNYDYPAGHYFPFPLAVATVHAEGAFWVQISLLP